VSGSKIHPKPLHLKPKKNKTPIQASDRDQITTQISSFFIFKKEKKNVLSHPFPLPSTEKSRACTLHAKNNIPSEVW